MRSISAVVVLVVGNSVGMIQAQEPKTLRVLAEHMAIVKKAKAPKSKTEGFVAKEASWTKMWKKLAPKGQAPKVDFSKQLVLVLVRDAADPNRINVTIRKNKEGVVELLAITTLIGFQPSDQRKFLFYVVSREGVQGVSRYDPKLRKRVVEPLPK
ncbi:MAG: hypothetical protein ACFCD0_21870 [Gemmataceae bacterium]